jgi:hypothetical protein
MQHQGGACGPAPLAIEPEAVRLPEGKRDENVVADMAHNITIKSTKTPSFPKG